MPSNIDRSFIKMFTRRLVQTVTRRFTSTSRPEPLSNEFLTLFCMILGGGIISCAQYFTLNRKLKQLSPDNINITHISDKLYFIDKILRDVKVDVITIKKDTDFIYAAMKRYTDSINQNINVNNSTIIDALKELHAETNSNLQELTKMLEPIVNKKQVETKSKLLQVAKWLI